MFFPPDQISQQPNPKAHLTGSPTRDQNKTFYRKPSRSLQLQTLSSEQPQETPPLTYLSVAGRAGCRGSFRKSRTFSPRVLPTKGRAWVQRWTLCPSFLIRSSLRDEIGRDSCCLGKENETLWSILRNTKRLSSFSTIHDTVIRSLNANLHWGKVLR